MIFTYLKTQSGILPKNNDLLTVLSFSPNADVEDPSLSATAPCCIRVWVEYTKEGLTINSGWADALIRVVEVELYRDSGHEKPLDDWKAEGGNPRSPKYLFGKDDPIYVKVPFYAGKSDETETFYDAVKVKSESDTSGDIKLSVKESFDAGQSCYNKLVDGELLYLDSSSDSNHIKVVDEEVLTFYLEVPPGGTYVESNSVMVDRGEFATGAARSYDSKLDPNPDPPDRTPLWNDNSDEFKNDITDPGEGDLDWWDVGEIRGSYGGDNSDFFDFVKDAGSNDSNNLEADMIYVDSHGDESATGLLIGTEPNVTDPSKEKTVLILDPFWDFESSDWNNDLDWAILHTCSTLQHDGTGRGKWEDMLKQSPRRAHGILGFEDPTRSDYKAYVDDFFDAINPQFHYKIIDAWITGNSTFFPWDNQPYAIVYHTENEDDKFQRPSEGICLTQDVASDAD